MITPRVCIQDGAFFRGTIDIRKPSENASPSTDPSYSGLAKRGSPLAELYDKQAEDEIASGQYEILDDEADFEDVVARWRS